MAKSKKTISEKQGKIIVFTTLIVCTLLFGVLIWDSVKADKEKNKPATEPEMEMISGLAIDEDIIDINDSNSFLNDADRAIKYSAGINKDGKINSVANADELCEIKILDGYDVYYKDFSDALDFELDFTANGRVIIGEYILNEIVAASDIEIDEVYKNHLVDLYNFIYEYYYASYTAYNESEGEDTWENIYDFFNGMSEDDYTKRIELSANKDARHYILTQALCKQKNITYTVEDIYSYCKYQKPSIKKVSEANSLIKEYGLAYIIQRTLEYNLCINLSELAKVNEGSYYDQFGEEYLNYSNGLYENGKIDGIGSIDSYVTLPEDIMLTGDAKQDFNEIYSETEFKQVDKYLNTITENDIKCLPGYELIVEDNEVEEYINGRMLIQALFSKYELTLDNSALKFADYYKLSDIDLERMNKVYGSAYMNQLYMELEVYNYISSLAD